jgi:hypothetical protein
VTVFGLCATSITLASVKVSVVVSPSVEVSVMWMVPNESPESLARAAPLPLSCTVTVRSSPLP